MTLLDQLVLLIHREIIAARPGLRCIVQIEQTNRGSNLTMFGDAAVRLVTPSHDLLAETSIGFRSLSIANASHHYRDDVVSHVVDELLVKLDQHTPSVEACWAALLPGLLAP